MKSIIHSIFLFFLPSLCHCVGKNIDEPLVMFGDIAMPTGLQNADPCTSRGCLWPKASDGNVYIPFRISNQYCKSQQLIIYYLFIELYTKYNP